MTVKEILEKTEFGKSMKVGIRDYNTINLGSAEYYLEEYKKAFRKNAAYRHREIKTLLDREAVVIEKNYCNFKGNYKNYDIITRRSFEGPFSKPLKDHEKIILE